jgi:hypothetical protein
MRDWESAAVTFHALRAPLMFLRFLQYSLSCRAECRDELLSVRLSACTLHWCEHVAPNPNCVHCLVSLSTRMISCFTCGYCRQTAFGHMATVLVFVACHKESQSDRHCLVGSFNCPSACRCQTVVARRLVPMVLHMTLKSLQGLCILVCNNSSIDSLTCVVIIRL